MLYRRSAQLAMQATLLLALEPEGSSRRVRDLADTLGVGAPYLAKVLHALIRGGVLRATRGPGGGVRLVRPACEISLWDVLSAIEEVDAFERCLLGLRRCNNQTPCPVHETWVPIRAQILAMLQSKNLWELAAKAQSRGVLRWDKTHRNGNSGRSPTPEGTRRHNPSRKTPEKEGKLGDRA